jgi:hypothetical protein
MDAIVVQVMIGRYYAYIPGYLGIISNVNFADGLYITAAFISRAGFDACIYIFYATYFAGSMHRPVSPFIKAKHFLIKPQIESAGGLRISCFLNKTEIRKGGQNSIAGTGYFESQKTKTSFYDTGHFKGLY